MAVADRSKQLLDVVRDLAEELHPGFGSAVGLDADLERDLGLDSLAVAELLVRLEDCLSVRIPDGVLRTAATPRDLLREILGVGEAPPSTEAGRPGEIVSERTETPAHAGTLVEALAWHVEAHPERVHIRLLDENGRTEDLTYGEMLRRAEGVAQGLWARSTGPGDAVALMLPTGAEYFTTFVGILLAGGVPVPIYPPVRASQLEDHLSRQVHILDNAQAKLLVTVPEARRVAGLVRARVESLHGVVGPRDLRAEGAGRRVSPRIAPGDVALLQYTSGSTGTPKGVVLTHENVMANIRAMGQAAGATSADVFVSWLPLYHDMGLIGAWLSSLYFGMPLVAMSPLTFLARPSRWLRAIHEHRGTIGVSPNFGYELCVRRVRVEEIEGIDLSSWRIAMNGAEPVSAQTLRRFEERFAPYGLRREAIFPAYGLAECAVALTFPPLGRGPVIDWVARGPFLRTGRAEPASPEDLAALQHVACGRPLPGHRIRVVDEAGEELPERRQGRIEFRGPSATRGYHRNPEATRRLFRDGWLDTGDLGYIAGGDLFVTGRVKDLIIRAGHNIHPQELEEAVGKLPGVRTGRVAAFASPDPGTGTERLVVVAETRSRSAARRAELCRGIIRLAVELTGTAPEDVVLAPPGTVLKTSSGKIRRAACREVYERGRIDVRRPPAWWQVVRFASAGLAARLRRTARRLGRFAYAGYAWIVLLVVGPVGWLLALLLPRESWRFGAFQATGRVLLRLTGIEVSVRGRDRLGATAGAVVVANHGSFLDGLVLATVLQGLPTFVVAREFAGRAIAGPFLRGIGAIFVERLERTRGVEDARRLAEQAHAGRSLVFFPEGTTSRAPGLQPFRMGAFFVAVEAGVPVVPVSIRGTRAILAAGRLAPRPGRVQVVVGEPIQAREAGWAGAVRLRVAARAALLEGSGEPDLVPLRLSAQISPAPRPDPRTGGERTLGDGPLSPHSAGSVGP